MFFISIRFFNGFARSVTGKSEPFVKKLRLSTPILKGFVNSPSISLKNCDITHCKFEWFRQISAKEKNLLMEERRELADKIQFDKNIYWLKVCNKLAYTPNDDDVAHKLKLICEPRDSLNIGQKSWTLSALPVEIGPTDCPFKKRHKFTNTSFLKDCSILRFVTYNILADLYADSEFSRTVLFSHCPPYALSIDYRRQLLLQEICGYNADIICLQEVDRKEFSHFYEPYMRVIANREGIFHTKGGQVTEGLALFYRRDRFEMIDSHKTVLRRLIDVHNESTSEEEEQTQNEIIDPGSDTMPKIGVDLHPILDNTNPESAKELLEHFDLIRSTISKNPLLLKRFIERHTILQTSLLKLEHRPNEFLIVANTHLYFAPDADHIRLLQTCICIRYLEYIRLYYNNLIMKRGLANGPVAIKIIFCGDMNSGPESGIHRLFQGGRINYDSEDWKSNPDERVVGLSFETDLRFATAYRDLQYTNYTPEFNGCLDYIYYETDGLELDRTVPLPEHEAVTSSGGLPSDVFPSDHIALIADLRLKS